MKNFKKIFLNSWNYYFQPETYLYISIKQSFNASFTKMFFNYIKKIIFQKSKLNLNTTFCYLFSISRLITDLIKILNMDKFAESETYSFCLDSFNTMKDRI